MAQKCLECLVVDGNYSKARIAGLFLGLISIAFFIWLIVLTVNLEKDYAAGTNATQDFEWDKISVTCSDKDDNKISTEPKENLKECKDLADSKDAKFIFYTDDKSCTMYNECDAKKSRFANNSGSTYKRGEKEWKPYDMTCGEDNDSYQVMAMVDSLDKCKEVASQFDQGEFIFFSTSPLSDKPTHECYFYNECNSTKVHYSESPGETYQRKIKED